MFSVVGFVVVVVVVVAVAVAVAVVVLLVLVLVLVLNVLVLNVLVLDPVPVHFVDSPQHLVVIALWIVKTLCRKRPAKIAITTIWTDGGSVVFCIHPDTARENSAER